MEKSAAACKSPSVYADTRALCIYMYIYIFAHACARPLLALSRLLLPTCSHVMMTSARVETEERSNFPRERHVACVRPYHKMLDLGVEIPPLMRNFSSLGRIYIGHAVYEISAPTIDSPRSRYVISLRRREAKNRATTTTTTATAENREECDGRQEADYLSCRGFSLSLSFLFPLAVPPRRLAEGPNAS